MKDIEQLQYGGLTDNKDEMSSLGDYKTGLFLYTEYLLDMFKYLINAYKDDEEELKELVNIFNETFETDFITKYELIHKFGDRVNRISGIGDKFIISKSSIYYKNLVKVKTEVKTEVNAENSNNVPSRIRSGLDTVVSNEGSKHVSQSVTGGDNTIHNERLEKGTMMYNKIKLLQYLTYIDTLHDFHDIKKLKKIYLAKLK